MWDETGHRPTANRTRAKRSKRLAAQKFRVADAHGLLFSELRVETAKTSGTHENAVGRAERLVYGARP